MQADEKAKRTYKSACGSVSDSQKLFFFSQNFLFFSPHSKNYLNFLCSVVLGMPFDAEIVPI